jgi:hypothetical protein
MKEIWESLDDKAMNFHLVCILAALHWLKREFSKEESTNSKNNSVSKQICCELITQKLLVDRSRLSHNWISNGNSKHENNIFYGRQTWKITAAKTTKCFQLSSSHHPPPFRQMYIHEFKPRNQELSWNAWWWLLRCNRRRWIIKTFLMSDSTLSLSHRTNNSIFSLSPTGILIRWNLSLSLSTQMKLPTTINRNRLKKLQKLIIDVMCLSDL